LWESTGGVTSTNEREQRGISGERGIITRGKKKNKKTKKKSDLITQETKSLVRLRGAKKEGTRRNGGGPRQRNKKGKPRTTLKNLF